MDMLNQVTTFFKLELLTYYSYYGTMRIVSNGNL